MKKIVYVDMDNVLVDFQSAFSRLPPAVFEAYKDKDDIPGIFALMEPMNGAVESFAELTARFDTYILSTAPWGNPSAWTDKLNWVKQHLGEAAYKRLILTHHKNLNVGDFLVDDRTARGVDRFQGEHIHFGTERFPDWPHVMDYLRPRRSSAAPLVADRPNATSV
jgi:5'-nucleotidase